MKKIRSIFIGMFIALGSVMFYACRAQVVSVAVIERDAAGGFYIFYDDGKVADVATELEIKIGQSEGQVYYQNAVAMILKKMYADGYKLYPATYGADTLGIAGYHLVLVKEE